MGKVSKDAKNPFYKNKYASLSNIIEAVNKPLNDNGLSIVQMPCNEGLTTMLVHSSGEWISSTSSTPVKDSTDPQKLGSAITYARRYALGAILSLNIDEDDDGQKASTPTVAKSAPVQKQAKAKPVLAFGTETFNKCVDWIMADEKRSIEAARKYYQINAQVEDELKKVIMVKHGLEPTDNQILNG